ncbi:TraB/GumN family protein [Mongoliimonas terrestris]|uniref:TraB/GumN family protein n=1 Tax=Mongoliimonas terrestris TaxID=1709001 RepID=UPI001588250F|nr:TraB/GumN family protein [Mongoliimonas terrestris]
MFRRLRSGLKAVASLVVPVLALAAPAAADPLLYVAGDGDSSVYIYGTVHSLRPEMPWYSQAVSAALAKSQSLWLEAGREPGETSNILRELGFAPSARLSARLAPDDLEALANAALSLGVDFDRIDPMRPWLAAATLGVAVNRREGLTALGVDLSLAGEASAHGIDVVGLDAPDEPVRIFASLPPEAELAMLNTLVADIAAGRRTNGELVDAWLAGDAEAIERLGHGQLKDADPRLYETLIAKRNTDWLPAVERLMLGAGSHFVAVGVLHVVGPHGLPALLAARGYTVERADADR